MGWNLTTQRVVSATGPKLKTFFLLEAQPPPPASLVATRLRIPPAVLSSSCALWASQPVSCPSSWSSASIHCFSLEGEVWNQWCFRESVPWRTVVLPGKISPDICQAQSLISLHPLGPGLCLPAHHICSHQGPRDLPVLGPDGDLLVPLFCNTSAIPMSWPAFLESLPWAFFLSQAVLPQTPSWISSFYMTSTYCSSELSLNLLWVSKSFQIFLCLSVPLHFSCQPQMHPSHWMSQSVLPTLCQFPLWKLGSTFSFLECQHSPLLALYTIHPIKNMRLPSPWLRLSPDVLGHATIYFFSPNCP